MDWSKHQFRSKDFAINEYTARILMAISVCLFTLNHDANLMQVLLGDVTASLSASLEFTRILNRLGITVSNETLKCYRFDVVSKLKDDNLKCFLDQYAFSVATVDNVDKGYTTCQVESRSKQLWISWNISSKCPG